MHRLALINHFLSCQKERMEKNGVLLQSALPMKRPNLDFGHVKAAANGNCYQNGQLESSQTVEIFQPDFSLPDQTEKTEFPSTCSWPHHSGEADSHAKLISQL